jgi:two-component system, OmpR family, phosphate regulon sensor histidine kinase PhoR
MQKTGDSSSFQDESMVFDRPSAIAQLLQELRTPLTNIKTALTLLNSPQIKPNQRQKYLDLIRRECDRQNLLINSTSELLTVGQEEDWEQDRPIDLLEVLPGAISTYESLAAAQNIKLISSLPAKLPLVTCPEAWVKRIVNELLQNSLKFTSSGGQIAVLVSHQGDAVQMDVRDSGIGIPLADLPHIFDRFYRTRQDNDGAGLGLALVQNLLLRCGGSITVTSQVETGSKFRVLLPVSIASP